MKNCFVELIKPEWSSFQCHFLYSECLPSFLECCACLLERFVENIEGIGVGFRVGNNVKVFQPQCERQATKPLFLVNFSY